jgi:hypothetical protein
MQDPSKASDVSNGVIYSTSANSTEPSSSQGSKPNMLSSMIIDFIRCAKVQKRLQSISFLKTKMWKEQNMRPLTQLHSYAVTQLHKVYLHCDFERKKLFILLYIIYYIYNIKYFFLPKVTAQLHLMQLRNCVTV